MDLIVRPRQGGKTTYCVQWLGEHDLNYLVVPDDNQRRHVLRMCHDAGFDKSIERRVVAAHRFTEMGFRLPHNAHVAVDELEGVLASLFRARPKLLTLTPTGDLL